MTRFICANLRVFFWTPMAAALWWSWRCGSALASTAACGDTFWWSSTAKIPTFSFQKSAGVAAGPGTLGQ